MKKESGYKKNPYQLFLPPTYRLLSIYLTNCSRTSCQWANRRSALVPLDEGLVLFKQQRSSVLPPDDKVDLFQVFELR